MPNKPTAPNSSSTNELGSGVIALLTVIEPFTVSGVLALLNVSPHYKPLFVGAESVRSTDPV